MWHPEKDAPCKISPVPTQNTHKTHFIGHQSLWHLKTVLVVCGWNGYQYPQTPSYPEGTNPTQYSKIPYDFPIKKETQNPPPPLGCWIHWGRTELFGKIHVWLSCSLSSWKAYALPCIRKRTLEWFVDPDWTSASSSYCERVPISSSTLCPEKMALLARSNRRFWIKGSRYCWSGQDEWPKVWGWTEGEGFSKEEDWLKS